MAHSGLSLMVGRGVRARFLAAALFTLAAVCEAGPRPAGRGGVIQDGSAILRLLSTPAVMTEVNRAVQAGYTMTDVSYMPSEDGLATVFVHVERRRPSGAMGVNSIELKAEIKPTGEVVARQVSPFRAGD